MVDRDVYHRVYKNTVCQLHLFVISLLVTQCNYCSFILWVCIAIIIVTAICSLFLDRKSSTSSSWSDFQIATCVRFYKTFSRQKSKYENTTCVRDCCVLYQSNTVLICYLKVPLIFQTLGWNLFINRCFWQSQPEQQTGLGLGPDL